MAMAEVDSHQPLTMEVQVQYDPNPCGICSRWSGSKTGFCPHKHVHLSNHEHN